MDFTLNDKVIPSKFLAIPTQLFQGIYAELSNDARLLYSFLLNRVSLSIKNKKVDENGSVYVICKQETAMQFLRCSIRKAGSVFKELESVGLIVKKRRYSTLPDEIFVQKVVKSVETVETEQENDTVTSEPKETGLNIDGFSMSEVTSKKEHNCPAKNDSYGHANFATPISKTKINNTEYNNINHSEPVINKTVDNGDNFIKVIKNQIDYDGLIEFQPQPFVKAVNVIVSRLNAIYTSAIGEMKINGHAYTYEELQDKFGSVTRDDVYTAVVSTANRMETQRILNVGQYMMTTLFNLINNKNNLTDLGYNPIVDYDHKANYENSDYRNRGNRKYKFQQENRDLSFLEL